MPSSIKLYVDEATALVSNLKQLNTKSNELSEKLSQAETSILKRLEWASTTNLSLRETQNQFETGSKRNQSSILGDNCLFDELIKLVEGWSSFEQLRVKANEFCEKEFESVLKLIDENDVIENESGSSSRYLSEFERNLIEFNKFNEKTQLNPTIVQVRGIKTTSKLFIWE